ncbi:hypothetical protein FBEOM_4456 [Fusarium beomiforme]|uniref:Uncharacterized protein n=1 Tax=Fusarium beomiforme TaxID=44412 RepID=A0A9P5AN46_9HYPO|nr:hypothetical protein FBEOM_4456 [Fusarium beomiforme]
MSNQPQTHNESTASTVLKRARCIKDNDVKIHQPQRLNQGENEDSRTYMKKPVAPVVINGNTDGPLQHNVSGADTNLTVHGKDLKKRTPCWKENDIDIHQPEPASQPAAQPPIVINYITVNTPANPTNKDDGSEPENESQEKEDHPVKNKKDSESPTQQDVSEVLKKAADLAKQKDKPEGKTPNPSTQVQVNMPDEQLKGSQRRKGREKRFMLPLPGYMTKEKYKQRLDQSWAWLIESIRMLKEKDPSITGDTLLDLRRKEDKDPESKEDKDPKRKEDEDPSMTLRWPKRKKDDKSWKERQQRKEKEKEKAGKEDREKDAEALETSREEGFQERQEKQQTKTAEEEFGKRAVDKPKSKEHTLWGIKPPSIPIHNKHKKDLIPPKDKKERNKEDCKKKSKSRPVKPKKDESPWRMRPPWAPPFVKHKEDPPNRKDKKKVKKEAQRKELKFRPIDDPLLPVTVPKDHGETWYRRPWPLWRPHYAEQKRDVEPEHSRKARQEAGKEAREKEAKLRTVHMPLMERKKTPKHERFRRYGANYGLWLGGRTKRDAEPCKGSGYWIHHPSKRDTEPCMTAGKVPITKRDTEPCKGSGYWIHHPSKRDAEACHPFRHCPGRTIIGGQPGKRDAGPGMEVSRQKQIKRGAVADCPCSKRKKGGRQKQSKRDAESCMKGTLRLARRCRLKDDYGKY